MPEQGQLDAQRHLSQLDRRRELESAFLRSGYRLALRQHHGFRITERNSEIRKQHLLRACNQGPWGRLFAINVNTGEIAWQTLPGITESLPADKRKTGRPNIGGSPATASGLVFIGAGDDSHCRAFDSKIGEEPDFPGDRSSGDSVMAFRLP